jgi:hypothetical protein
MHPTSLVVQINLTAVWLALGFILKGHRKLAVLIMLFLDWPQFSRRRFYISRGPGFDFRPYQIFLEVGGLERGPLSLVRTIEKLLE